MADRLLDAGVLVPHAGPHPDPPPMSEVTVVVPVRDDVDGLGRCLRGVRALWPDVGAVVVDDGSGDPRAVEQAAAAHGARLLRRETPGGPGTARNEALGQVVTPYVLLVDADVEIVGPDPWPRWWSLLEDPVVAVVAPRVKGVGGEGSGGVYERARFPLDLGELASRIAPGARVTYAPAALLVARTAALDGAGGFDPTLRYGEDVDLLWRLTDAGWRCWYDPIPAARHEIRPGPVARSRQRFDYGTAAAPLAVRHAARLAPWRGSRWTPVVIGLLLAGRPAAAAVVTGANSLGLSRRVGDRGVDMAASVRLVTAGHAASGRALLRALVRPWWPMTLTASWMLPRHVRRRVLAALVVPALWEWVESGPPLDPLRWTWWWLVDDVSYGAGVWAGWWRRRRDRRAAGALAPRFTEWPGRRPTGARTRGDGPG